MAELTTNNISDLITAGVENAFGRETVKQDITDAIISGMSSINNLSADIGKSVEEGQKRAFKSKEYQKVQEKVNEHLAEITTTDEKADRGDGGIIDQIIDRSSKKQESIFAKFFGEGAFKERENFENRGIRGQISDRRINQLRNSNNFLSKSMGKLGGILKKGGAIGLIFEGIKQVFTQFYSLFRTPLSQRVIDGIVTGMETYFDKAFPKLVSDNITKNFIEKLQFRPEDAIAFWNEVNKQVGETNIGLLQSGNLALKFKQNTIDLAINLANIGLTWQDAMKIQADFNNQFERGVVLSNEELKKIGEVVKVLGDGYINVFTKSRELGVDAVKANSRLTELLMQSQKEGLNAAKVAEKFKDNIELIDDFHFNSGIQGLQDMAKLSAKTRLNLQSATQLAENLFEPEQAIEMAAALQALGGQFSALGDPYDLLYKARNSPDKLLEDIHEMTKGMATFNETTGELEVNQLSRSVFREFEKITGGAVKSADLVRSARQSFLRDLVDQEALGSQISNITDQTKDLLTSLATIDSSGNLKFELDGQTLGIEDINDQILGSLENANLSQEEFWQKTVTLNQDMVTQLENVANKLNLFIPENLYESVKESSQSIVKFGESINLGTEKALKLEENLDRIYGTLSETILKSSEGINDITNGFDLNKILDVIVPIQNEVGKFDNLVSNAFTGLMEMVSKLIKWLEKHSGTISNVAKLGNPVTAPAAIAQEILKMNQKSNTEAKEIKTSYTTQHKELTDALNFNTQAIDKNSNRNVIEATNEASNEYLKSLIDEENTTFTIDPKQINIINEIDDDKINNGKSTFPVNKEDNLRLEDIRDSDRSKIKTSSSVNENGELSVNINLTADQNTLTAFQEGYIDKEEIKKIVFDAIHAHLNQENVTGNDLNTQRSAENSTY